MHDVSRRPCCPYWWTQRNYRWRKWWHSDPTKHRNRISAGWMNQLKWRESCETSASMTKESSVDEERKRWSLPETGARKMIETDVISSDRLVNESIIDFTELNSASSTEKDLKWNESFTGEMKKKSDIEKENIKPPGNVLEENIVLSICCFSLFHELHSVGEKISCAKVERWASELRRERTVERLSNGLFVDCWDSLNEIDLNWENLFSLEEEEMFLALHFKTSREHFVHLMSSWTISLLYLNWLASLIS